MNMKNVRNGLRTWVEVDRQAIKKNYQLFRSLIAPKTKLMAVVKSNAYGHGLVNFSKEIVRLGADWLGVDSVEEGLELRQAGIKNPILIFGFTPFEAIAKAAKADLSVTVSNLAVLNFLKSYRGKKPVKIHIKVDSGLHRQGFMLEDLPKVLSLLKIMVRQAHHEGLYTHFATAEQPDSPYTKRQIDEFKIWTKAFEQAGFNPIKHTAGTAATMLFPEAHFDIVRIGIGLYGLWPSPEVKNKIGKKINLSPVLSWKGIIGDVKKVMKGERIGYDLTERLERDSQIATCGVGYWHGLPRNLSGCGIVSIKGQPARILGRVSMDIITLDVTDIPEVKTGDEVNFPVEQLAELTKTINYEIVTRINPYIPRLFK